MSVITDATTAWSGGVTLTVDEIWQNRKRPHLSVATGVSAPVSELDGVKLGALDSIYLQAGLTVYYRADEAGSAFTRTAVSV